MGLSTEGDRLWEARMSAHEIWPLMVRSQDGSRLARETVVLKFTLGSKVHTLAPEDVRGQIVRVIDAADGHVVLDAPANPTYDAGGNVAISPSGRRAAILNGGAIQVFDLPAAPPAPKYRARK